MSKQQQQEAILVQHPTEPWGLVIKVQRKGSDPELTQAERLILALRAQVERLHAVESGAKVELMRRDNLIDSLHGLCESYRTQAESLQAEVNEQARLNGMGAERELALMAKVEILQAASVEWSPAYTRGPARQSAPVTAVPAMVPLSDEQLASIYANCPLDNGFDEFVASIREYESARGITQNRVAAPKPALVCNVCGVDRLKEDCKGDRMRCGMQAVGYGIGLTVGDGAQPIKDAP